MQSGVFQVGEKVVGRVRRTGLSPVNGEAGPKITFRVAQTNHKEGPYNAPTSVFTNNPYVSQVSASEVETYTGTPGITQLRGQEALYCHPPIRQHLLF